MVLVYYFRYDIPGIHAMNFMLLNSLGGGGISSLRSDPQVTFDLYCQVNVKNNS